MNRRAFLRLLSAAGVSTAAGVSFWRPRAFAAPPLFEPIAPSASGITWVHENAMSPSRFLPETMGPGVAFVDFDNDGSPTTTTTGIRISP